MSASETDRTLHRYELVERIAVGGMAEVFRARGANRLGTGEIVAALGERLRRPITANRLARTLKPYGAALPWPKRAGAWARSMIRPPWNGPRSLMRTTTARPVRSLTTRTLVPKGSER